MLHEIYDRLSNFEKISKTALEKLCGNLIHLFVACFIVLLVLLPWHLFFHIVNHYNGHFRVHSWQGFLTHHCIVTLQRASELAPQLTLKGVQLRIQLFYLQDLFFNLLSFCAPSNITGMKCFCDFHALSNLLISGSTAWIQRFE